MLLFITTGIITWIKSYLTEVIHISKELTDILFVVYCVTAPLSGILFGGFYVRRKGGYSSINCYYYILFDTICCMMLTIVIALSYNIVVVSIAIWLFLFFGASIVPCIGGTMLSVLPINLKGSGNSFQILFISIIGRSPAPTVYAYIYEKTKTTLPNLAMTVLLATSVIGFFLMLLAIYYKKKSHKNYDIPPKAIIEKINPSYIEEHKDKYHDFAQYDKIDSKNQDSLV